MLKDGKSVDCRVPKKHSDGEKKVKAVRCPILQKKRKSEEEIRAQEFSLYDYGIHVINEGLMLIGGITLTLMSYVC